MRNISTTLLCLLMAISTVLLGQGSNQALLFAATADRENVVLGNLPLDTTNFTIEMWIYVENVSSDEAFFSNKDWSSGNNTGIVLAMTGANTLKFNFKAPNGTRVDINNVAGDFIQKWNHVAVVVDRNAPSATVYINGIEGGTSTSTNLAKSNGSIASTYPFRLGQDGTGDYSISYDGNNTSFHGQIDEVKVWNTVRTQADIHTQMCQKTLPQAALLAYYNMDILAAVVVSDVSGNGYDGMLATAGSSVPIWQTSGAPIGDASVFTYNSNWSGINLSQNSLASGNFTIDNITGFEGLHIYQVTESPNTQNGIPTPDADSAYFGVFTIGTGTAQATYDYSNYPNANTYETLTQLYSREMNSNTFWNVLPTSKNTVANTFSFAVSNPQSEYKIGNFAQNCGNPATLNASNISYNSATINWLGSSSPISNVVWGLQGITPSTGTSVLAVAGGSYNLNGLLAQTTYSFFVKDSCAGTPNPTWVGPFTFTTTVNTATLKSAVSALSFADNNTQYVSCGNYPEFKVQSNITLEAWVKAQPAQTDYAALFTFLQDNASNESGYGLVWHAGKWRMFMMTENMGANAWNNAPGAEVPDNTWTHIAGTYDGAMIRCYMNGILVDSMAATGNIDWTYDPLDFRIGTFYDDNENVAFNGNVDEIRVWSKAKTATEIRAEMCHGLQGNEAGLVTYYRCNEKSGTILNDFSVNSHHGTVNHPQTAWVNSGAAIGEASTYIYPTTWTGANLSITTTNKGNLQVNNVNGNAKGLHLYKAPIAGTVSTGTQDIANNDTYFGAFLVNGTTTQYDFSFNYANYSAALAAENNLRTYNRWDNSYTTWIDYGTNANLSANLQTANKVMGNREWLLAEFTAINCPGSYDLTANNITPSQADIDWSSVAGNTWDMEYGTAYFAQGTGTATNNLAVSNKNITGLAGTTLYDVFVKDYCTGANSHWVGPFRFYTADACPNPSNFTATVTGLNSATLSWTTGGSNKWNLQYGVQNFTLGLGIPINNTSNNPYNLTSLSAGTTYDVYIQDTCGANGASIWIGPITFTTNSVGIATAKPQHFATVLPNPTKGNIYLMFEEAPSQPIDVVITDMQGKMVAEKHIEKSEKTQFISLLTLSSGIYVCRIATEWGTQVEKLVIE